jgi:hypothetical protein
MLRIYGSQRNEVIAGWSKLHSEELDNLHSSPNRMTESRRMRWAGRVVWERRGIDLVFWCEDN